jgi:type VI protein secretion system component Hcp
MAVDCFMYLEDENGEQIKGETTDLTFKDCIEIFKFDFDAVSQVDTAKLLGEGPALSPGRLMGNGPITNGDPTQALSNSQSDLNKIQSEQTGRDSFTFTIEKQVDCSTPSLFRSYCRATARDKAVPAFKSATVYVLVGGQKRTPDADWEKLSIVVMEFENLHVTSYQIKHDEDLNIPDEKITFYFDKYVMNYRWQEVSGATGQDPVKKGFDFKSLKPLP